MKKQLIMTTFILLAAIRGLANDDSARLEKIQKIATEKQKKLDVEMAKSFANTPAKYEARAEADFKRQHPLVQKRVEDTYAELQLFYGQKKYELAQAKGEVIKFMLHYGYKDTEKILRALVSATAAIPSHIKDEAVRVERDKQAAFVESLFAVCKKSLKAGMPKGSMATCLEQVLAWPPSRLDAEELLKAAKKIEATH